MGKSRSHLVHVPSAKNIMNKKLLFSPSVLNSIWRLFYSAPTYLTSLIKIYQPGRPGLRSGSDNTLLAVPKVHSAARDRAFYTHAPRLWNHLPHQIRSAESLAVFKKHLKTFLFNDWLLWLFPIISAIIYLLIVKFLVKCCGTLCKSAIYKCVLLFIIINAYWPITTHCTAKSLTL